jgi:hypothetical protein
MVYADTVGWPLKTIAGSRILLDVVFYRVIVEKGRANCEGALSILLLVDHAAGEIFKRLINGLGLPDGHMIDAEISVFLLLGQFFEFCHPIVVKARGNMG